MAQKQWKSVRVRTGNMGKVTPFLNSLGIGAGEALVVPVDIPLARQEWPILLQVFTDMETPEEL